MEYITRPIVFMQPLEHFNGCFNYSFMMNKQPLEHFYRSLELLLERVPSNELVETQKWIWRLEQGTLFPVRCCRFISIAIAIITQQQSFNDGLSALKRKRVACFGPHWPHKRPHLPKIRAYGCHWTSHCLVIWRTWLDKIGYGLFFLVCA